ncbi:hypothetical protein B0H11DRAFT_1959225 [Mycena galericulata]|nr:hypothetical protein B0H11DRAFT_1959225 [Mycena galericulata]
MQQQSSPIPSMSQFPLKADAVIVGGGPVGSLIAYQLARFGCRPYLMEQEDKKTMAYYGRASTMWPRSIEMLDQLDLAERLIQIGVVTRNALHFRDGRRSTGGLMFGSRMDKLGKLHLRQRLTEEQFAEALEEKGVEQHMLRRIEGDLEKDEGGKSTVRSLAGIRFNGERTTHRWIRMDARVRTNMPNPRCLNSIDSKFHGQILWCPIDNGLTRIGYVFSQALLEKYGGIEGEAIQALQPFEVEFLEGIGQAIAETFCAQDRVFLAGDACHTHSSGSAQGLNTAKNAGRVSNRWVAASPALSFRITLISMLISGQYPPRFEGRKEDPRDILTEWYTDVNIQLFTLGLAVNTLNSASSDPSAATIVPGERGPDVYLTTIGTGDPIRLHQILKNEAKFHIVVFTGNPSLTRNALVALHTGLAAPTSFTRAFPTRWAWGRVYWDAEGRAHGMYGVDEARGAVIVFRPDGWVGCVMALEDVQNLGAYFRELLV